MVRGNSLRLHVHRVTSLTVATETSFHEGNLKVSAEGAAGILRDPALGTVGLTLVSPGESIRMVKILDAVEPRTKGPGGGGIFPGFLAPDSAQGTGDTHVLRGAAVVVAGHLPRGQEAVVDMSGPAAHLSHLGSTHNIVIEFEPAEGAAWKDVDDALRRGSLRLAARLAEAALETTADTIEELAPPYEHGSRASAQQPAAERLPRVGTITNLQTQGVFKDVFVRGTSLAGRDPMAIDPRELDDGAVVGGQYGHPGLRNNTYMHQNNPVVAALRDRD
ncbi:MAG: glycine/sarcosine/betaine reductase component B subunit, partial [Candidatus Dormibacteria bacterium]